MSKITAINKIIEFRRDLYYRIHSQRPKKFRTRYISTSRWIFLAFSSIELKKINDIL